MVDIYPFEYTAHGVESLDFLLSCLGVEDFDADDPALAGSCLSTPFTVEVHEDKVVVHGAVYGRQVFSRANDDPADGYEFGGDDDDTITLEAGDGAVVSISHNREVVVNIYAGECDG